jgi:hypothetical protein
LTLAANHNILQIVDVCQEHEKEMKWVVDFCKLYYCFVLHCYLCNVYCFMYCVIPVCYFTLSLIFECILLQLIGDNLF